MRCSAPGNRRGERMRIKPMPRKLHSIKECDRNIVLEALIRIPVIQNVHHGQLERMQRARRLDHLQRLFAEMTIGFAVEHYLDHGRIIRERNAKLFSAAACGSAVCVYSSTVRKRSYRISRSAAI